MPPSRFARRCLVFLLLVAVAAGFLARPAEATKRPFADIVDDASRRHGVDPDLVHAVIAVESGYRASAQSPAGAQGLMQLMPGTQRDLGVADAFDPRQNVDAGVAYLRRLTDEFGTVLALAAYNAGPGAVRRYNGIPPYKETRAYVQAVLDRGRAVADAQAPAEHDPSGDRARAAAETNVAEGNPGDRRLQDHHLAADGAAGLEPQALDLDDRARPALRPDTVGNPRGAQTGALRKDVADERPVQVGAGSAHAAADTALLALHHGAERLRRQAWRRSSPVRIPRRCAGPQRRLQPAPDVLGRQDRRTTLPVHSRGDVLDPLETPSAVGPVLAGQLAGQRTQVDAQRRPARGHLDPALVAVAELHARAVDQQQPSGRRAGMHRHRMPLAGGRPPHDGQVQLRLLFDRDPAGVEEVLRVRERRVLRAPQRPVLIDVGEQPGRTSSNARYNPSSTCVAGRSNNDRGNGDLDGSACAEMANAMRAARRLLNTPKSPAWATSISRSPRDAAASGSNNA